MKDERRERLKDMAQELQVTNKKLTGLLVALSLAKEEDKVILNAQIASTKATLNIVTKDSEVLKMNKYNSRAFQWIPSGKRMNRQQARDFRRSL